MFKKIKSMFSRKTVDVAQTVDTPDVEGANQITTKKTELTGWPRFRSIMGLIGWIVAAAAVYELWVYTHAPMLAKAARVFGSSGFLGF